jgi:flavin reductase (DIM6/NTAB) family NADH-FMN oxidoreductase RutF
VSTPLSREDFFSIMSAFPTGVAIVTTLDEHGEPKGLTTNAVCSVSAEPPTSAAAPSGRSAGRDASSSTS